MVTSRSRTSLVTLAIVTFVLHQLISIALFVVEFPRGEASLPPDVLNYLLRILEWPFLLLPAPTAAHLSSPPASLLLVAWLFGSVFWASVVCVVAVLWRRFTHSNARVNT